MPAPVAIAGAGPFLGSYECFIAGPVGTIVTFPTTPVPSGAIRTVTLTTSDAQVPPLQVSDDDGNTYADMTPGTAPPNQRVFRCTTVGARAVGGNKLTFVFPNAIQKAHDPVVRIADCWPPSVVPPAAVVGAQGRPRIPATLGAAGGAPQAGPAFSPAKLGAGVLRR